MWLIIRVVPVIYFIGFCAAQEDIPTPSLQLQSGWRDVFPFEKAVFRCTIEGSSDWTVIWEKNKQQLDPDADPNVSLSPDSSILTITAESQIYAGDYSCKGHDRKRSITTVDSDSISLVVYANKPKPNVTQIPNFDKLYPGETVNLTCQFPLSSEWKYVWFHNNKEIQASSRYSIPNIDHRHNGKYHCKAMRGQNTFYTEESDTITLQVSDLPKPSLKLLTDWPDVFEEEIVAFGCEVAGSSDWTFSWYKDKVKILDDTDLFIDDEGVLLNITLVTQSDEGVYSCRAHLESRRVNSDFSDPTKLTVYDKTPKPTLHRIPVFNPMYVGERVNFTCNVDVSTGWEYQWMKNGNDESATSKSYSFPLGLSDQGKYSCKATRSERTSTEESEKIQLDAVEVPAPSLSGKTPWLDVFPGETVELQCGISGSSGWTFTWSRDGVDVHADNVVSFDTTGAVLTLQSASAAHAGQYTCRGHLRERSVSSSSSSGITLTVYDKTPKPTLHRIPVFNPMYVGERVNFTCNVDVSTGWEYQWMKNGNDESTTSKSYSFPLGLSDQGKYSCKATRSERTSTEESEKIQLDVFEVPVPSLSGKTPWLDVFPGETVELQCGISGSSGWTFTWSRDGADVHADNVVSFDTTGAVLTLQSASAAHAGQYTCRGHLRERSVSSSSSSGITLTVYGEIPSVKMTQDPDFSVMFIGETVSFSCHVNISSGWGYQWYKDKKKLSKSGQTFVIKPTNSGTYSCRAKRGINHEFLTDFSRAVPLQVKGNKPKPLLIQNPSLGKVYIGESVTFECKVEISTGWGLLWYKDETLQTFSGSRYTIEANSSDSGTYKCMAMRIKTVYQTEYSDTRTLLVSDIPVPETRRETQWLDVFTAEKVALSCVMDGSSDWIFTWYQDNKKLQAGDATSFSNDAATLSINSASVLHSGRYTCSGKLKSRSVNSKVSSGLTLSVYERAKASIILLTGWSQVFSTDNLVLQCGVQDDLKWNYTWFRENKEVNTSHLEKYTVTPQNNPEQSVFTCMGIRKGRPSYSKKSEPLTTKNLLLKRRVLLSISGCLFFGIIVVFLGCIILRVFRKPVYNEEKPEEEDLFLTMAQLKGTDIPCPLVDFITDATLKASAKAEEDDNGTICSETTPLPITPQEDPAVTSETPDTAENNGGLVSFK